MDTDKDKSQDSETNPNYEFLEKFLNKYIDEYYASLGVSLDRDDANEDYADTASKSSERRRFDPYEDVHVFEYGEEGDEENYLELNPLDKRSRSSYYMPDNLDMHEVAALIPVLTRYFDGYYRARLKYGEIEAMNKVATDAFFYDQGPDFGERFINTFLRVHDNVSRHKQDLLDLLKSGGSYADFLDKHIKRLFDDYSFNASELYDIEHTIDLNNKSFFIILHNTLQSLRNGKAMDESKSRRAMREFRPIKRDGYHEHEWPKYAGPIANKIAKQLRIISYIHARVCIEQDSERKRIFNNAFEDFPLYSDAIFGGDEERGYKAATAIAFKQSQNRSETSSILDHQTEDELIALIAIRTYDLAKEKCYGTLPDADTSRIRKMMEISYLSTFAAMCDIYLERFDWSYNALNHINQYTWSTGIFIALGRAGNWVSPEEIEYERREREREEYHKRMNDFECKMVRDLIFIPIIAPFILIYGAILYIIHDLPCAIYRRLTGQHGGQKK